MYNIIGNNFIEMIRSINNDAKIASGGREVIVRCPYCGDSKNARHAHMYISVPNGIDDLSFFDCKKCPAHGIVDDEFLRKIGCYDSRVLVAVAKHNSDISKLPKYRSMKNINIYPLNNNTVTMNDISDKKLEYINSRIGSNFNYDYLLSLKIFINLYDVINNNRLGLSRDKRICDQLDANFIGFISYDNSFCTMRKVFDCDNQYVNKRYINYSLVGKNNSSKNFYVIPTSIDVMNGQPIRIHIAEGPFDVLSIFYNLNNCNMMNNIYIASMGKSYKQALQFILMETGIINYEIHLYPDMDVDNYELNRLVLNSIINLPCRIFIHRNIMNGEKDFGVPKEKIKDSVRVIK